MGFFRDGVCLSRAIVTHLYIWFITCATLSRVLSPTWRITAVSCVTCALPRRCKLVSLRSPLHTSGWGTCCGLILSLTTPTQSASYQLRYIYPLRECPSVKSHSPLTESGPYTVFETLAELLAIICMHQSSSSIALSLGGQVQRVLSAIHKQNQVQCAKMQSLNRFAHYKITQVGPECLAQ